MRSSLLPIVLSVMLAAGWAATSCTQGMRPLALHVEPDAGALVCNLPQREPVIQHATRLIEEGRRTFRYETFGDEAFWGEALQLHRAIRGEPLGLSPRSALSLGLKFDEEALSPALRQQLDLDDPQTTLRLLELDAVVGLKGFFGDDGTLNSIGVQCALCHSTVDDSTSAGIGKRLDGWANRDLDIGAIIALSPDVSTFTTLLGVSEETVRTVLNAWGPGRFNAQLLLDGKSFRPDGRPAGSLIPPAFGLAGFGQHTTGWHMNGKGTFWDPRLDDEDRFPIAAREGFSNVRHAPDLTTAKLAALQVYQTVLRAPAPQEGTFDTDFAARGKLLFEGKARCATCHVPPLFTEPGWNLHTAEELGIDDFQARRSPDERYRTAPLAGLFSHAKGGFYHDGRFATLGDVITHYDTHFRLGLSAKEKTELGEYLQSL
ncbi:MAG: hypothetical protein Q8K32_30270 [Archangium sp.]|nr:hypothetical protein [Archangium sp.]